MAGILEDGLHAALLHDHAVSHDRHPIGEVRDDGQVMADHEHRRPGPLQTAQQAEDLRGDRRVQRRRRLVRDEEARVRGDRGGDERPLAEPAGELVRVLGSPDLGIRHADRGQEFDDALAACGTAEVSVQAQDLAHLVTHRAEGVER